MLDDLDLSFDQIAASDTLGAAGRLRGLVEALDVLGSQPFTGRTVPIGQRELVMGKRAGLPCPAP